MGAANELRRQFAGALKRRGDPALAVFVEALTGSECLERTIAGSVPGHAAGHLRAATDGLGCEAPLAGAIGKFAAKASWYCLLEGADLDQGLVDGMLVGRPDLPERAALRLGLFLIAPHVLYPLHQHGAEEVYFVASGRLEIQHGRDGTPFALEPGEYSVTPSNRLHALQTGERPALIAYAWAGRIADPSWWWASDAKGWHRTRWERAESGIWSREATEPVTEAILAEAGEIA